jgi:hypothetical protein
LAAEWGGPQQVLCLTPRQFLAFLQLSSDRHNRGLGETLMIAALGARGDAKQVQKLITKLSGE